LSWPKRADKDNQIYYDCTHTHTRKKKRIKKTGMVLPVGFYFLLLGGENEKKNYVIEKKS